MRPASLAALTMAPIHCLFGLHIVRRGVIFIDLAVAQVAALGMAIAVARGYDPHSVTTHGFAVGSALIAAMLISLTRFRLGLVPHEAMIGIIFVVGSALSVVVLENTPHGLEELRDTLSGNILFVADKEVTTTMWLYLGVLVVLMLLWRSITDITLRPEAKRTAWQTVAVDLAFYALLGVVVASSVKVAGVLVVFSWLVMPAVCAFLFWSKMSVAVVVSLPIALISTGGALWLSYSRDWPTGPSIVIVLGAVTGILYAVKLIMPQKALGTAGEHP